MATIIRKDEQREAISTPTIRAAAFSFGDMRGQAEEYLGMVRSEAAKIVQKAHQDAEQIRKQAEIAGRKAAEKAIDRMIEEKLAKRMDSLIPALEKTAAQLDDAKGELLHQWEQSAVRVATTMAQRIIRRELSTTPEIALDVVADTLRLATGASEITVFVSPSDHEHLGTQITRLAQTLCRVAPTAIVPDPTISAGGCKVTTKHGEVDQQIESQLKRIEEELA
jgi:flagellar biosynthesis/type III secretory pathway protein FliH